MFALVLPKARMMVSDVLAPSQNGNLAYPVGSSFFQRLACNCLSPVAQALCLSTLAQDLVFSCFFGKIDSRSLGAMFWKDGPARPFGFRSLSLFELYRYL